MPRVWPKRSAEHREQDDVADNSIQV